MALLFRWSLVLALMGAVVDRAIAAGVVSGDFVVVDFQTGAVVRVDPMSGAQTVMLSGPSFTDIATEENGRFAATFAGTTGAARATSIRSPRRSPRSPRAPRGRSPPGVAAGKAGHILAADKFALVPCSSNGGTVFDVDPVAGTAIAELCLHAHPLDVVLESSDSVLIASENLGLVRFSPGTLAFRILAARNAAFNPQAVALASDGVIFALSRAGTSSTATDIFRIDPVTGAKAGISSGGLFVDLKGIAVAPNGDLLVTDAQALPDGAGAKGTLLRVDPVTGAFSRRGIECYTSD